MVALAALTALAAALFGAAPAEAGWSTVDLRGARPFHAGAAIAEQRRARHRHSGVARHHALVRGHRHRGKRRGAKPQHPAAGPTAVPPAGSPPSWAPGAPQPGFANPPVPQAPARSEGAPAPQGAAAAPPPAGRHGVEIDPEPEVPPTGEPEPPTGEPQEPPAEEPGTPPAEEPEPPAEEPEPPAAEEPEPPSGEEPEPPQQEPEAPNPQLLFEGSRIRDFPLVQAAPGAITEVPDPLGSGQTVFQLTVDDGDVAPLTPTENPRAQLVSPDLVEAGDEFSLKTKFLIPQNFPTVTGWMSVLSIYGPPFNASSPWQIEVVGDHLQWTRNRTYGFDVPWQAPLIKGAWVTVLTHERFAEDGFVEMWIDGQPVSFFGRETRLEMKTMDTSNGAGANSIRMTQYRQAGMFETGTTYFGPVRFGTTRAAVGG
ncbi:MAG: heparin lyase I family protein [Solirubrobacterales bacterium]